MTLLNVAARRTQAFAPELEEQISRTHKGMAHFAASGPRGTLCRQCAHYDLRGKNSFRSAVCFKFQNLTNVEGPKIPADAAACKYFEAAS